MVNHVTSIIAGLTAISGSCLPEGERLPLRPAMPLTVRIINTSPHAHPAYQTAGASGMDLRAWLSAPVELAPLERVLIPTGLFLELPAGYEAQVRPRSGLAINNGLTLVNAPGTIDSDYRGEIKVPLINLSQQPQVINDGDRIAQMIVARYERVIWEQVDSLEQSARGTGGFGHSGNS
jgi:dUTP pyrophosphatase